MDTFSSEFGLEFKVQRSFPHVIDPRRQVYSAICQSFPTGTKLNFSYASRDNQNLVDDLGKFLKACFIVVPKGMLVFFTSYAMMNSYINTWKASGLLGELQSIKRVCIETSKNASHFKTELKHFIHNYKKGGAALFGVFGGKLSEGMDFSDDMARLVILIGIPFANVKSLGVAGKRAYLDKLRSYEKHIEVRTKDGGTRNFPRQSGTDWYQASAVRTYNQAIGRVIRHRGDYGSALLLDERFAWDKFKTQISEWAQSNLQIAASTRTCLDDLKDFYRAAPAYCTSMGYGTKVIDEAKFVKDSTSRLQDLMNRADDDGDKPEKNKPRYFNRFSEKVKDQVGDSKSEEPKFKMYRRNTEKAGENKVGSLGEIAEGQSQYKRKSNFQGKYASKTQQQQTQGNTQVASLLQGTPKISNFFKQTTPSMNMEGTFGDIVGEYRPGPSNYSEKIDELFKSNMTKVKKSHPNENIEKFISLDRNGVICVNGKVPQDGEYHFNLKDIERISLLKKEHAERVPKSVPNISADNLPRNTDLTPNNLVPTTANQLTNQIKEKQRNVEASISKERDMISFQCLVQNDPEPSKQKPNPTAILQSKSEDQGPKWAVDSKADDDLPFFKQRSKK